MLAMEVEHMSGVRVWDHHFKTGNLWFKPEKT